MIFELSLHNLRRECWQSYYYLTIILELSLSNLTIALQYSGPKLQSLRGETGNKLTTILQWSLLRNLTFVLQYSSPKLASLRKETVNNLTIILLLLELSKSNLTISLPYSGPKIVFAQSYFCLTIL